ncbi:hypothetical protein CEXT_157541 [Caerostris extrusa]|uniref:Uncharacterized protein n=1 Tax=Caerostris extrusa TaxID=172846 RepID=A0AAV4SKN8_CAEEX|nr:hypothetical protein CEXT_157541 [Caerostris extrusa]
MSLAICGYSFRKKRISFDRVHLRSPFWTSLKLLKHFLKSASDIDENKYSRKVPKLIRIDHLLMGANGIDRFTWFRNPRSIRTFSINLGVCLSSRSVITFEYTKPTVTNVLRQDIVIVSFRLRSNCNTRKPANILSNALNLESNI